MALKAIERGIQLLVEGNDARNFFGAFVKHLLYQDVQVQNFGGVNELRGFMEALTVAPDFRNVRSIGIVRDAENSAVGAFQSIRDSLEHAGLPVPRRPAEPAGEHPSVRVLILPGGEDSGMLETLLCKTFASTAVDGCIDAFLQCTEASSQPVRRPDKARAHAWLVTQPDPHISVGVAAQKGYWDFDHNTFGDIRSFLTSL